MTVIALVITLLWWPIGAVLYTLVLSVLWRWFLLPLGLPELSLPHLYGVAIIVSLLTIETPKPDSDGDPISAVIAGIFMSLFRLGIVLAAGWVAMSLMGGQ